MTRPYSTVVEFKPGNNPAPTTAEGWCARLHADDVSAGDRTAFESWISASPENRAEYELCALTFGLARSLPDAPDLHATLRLTSSSEKCEQPSALKRRYWFAAAAVILICAVGLLIWSAAHSAYVTGVGEQKLISLQDGTTVQLNTASSVRVTLDDSQRRVTLNRGEAFFNVAQEAARPFIVQAGSTQIRVMGTKFNVRLDGDKTSVTVLEGRVRVDGLDLLPGETARAAASIRPTKMAAVNASKLTSWREGKIYFDYEPLSKVLQEVNRYSQTQFVIDGPQAQALRLSGVFRTGDTDSVAFALRETYGLKTQRVGGRIRVY